MLRPTVATGAGAPDADDGVERDDSRRPAIEELQRLGPAYAVLNQLAPLLRLYAIFTFVAGSSAAYRGLLEVVMASIVSGLSRPAFHRLGGAIAINSAPGGLTEDESAFHQMRMLWAQAVRCALFMTLVGAATARLDGGAYGLSVLPGGGGAWPPVLVGVGAAVAMAAVWSLVHARSAREKLAMADGTHDLSAASEDELLRGMRPSLRAASLGLRCATIALETFADVVLLFVFLPSALDGLSTPTSAPHSALSSGAAALVYGSQHLRFRGEWLLCTTFGLGLLALPHYAPLITGAPADTSGSGAREAATDGALCAPLVAAVLFAVFRHARRTGLDVRRFHAQ